MSSLLWIAGQVYTARRGRSAIAKEIGVIILREKAVNKSLAVCVQFLVWVEVRFPEGSPGVGIILLGAHKRVVHTGFY